MPVRMPFRVPVLAAFPLVAAALAAAPAHADPQPYAYGDAVDDPAPDGVEATAWIALRSSDGACLDAADGAVVAAACSGEDSQLWSFDGDHLVNGAGGCLAVATQGRGHGEPAGERLGRAGARLVVTACAERRSQRFESADGALVDAAGLCAEVDADGAAVRSAPCGDDARQRFAEVEVAQVDDGEVYDPAGDAAVVVHGPATIVVPPAPMAAPDFVPGLAAGCGFAAPGPVSRGIDQVFHVLDHAIGTFRGLVDLVAPGGLGR